MVKRLISKLEGVKELTIQEKKLINAGKPYDWDRCCLKEDSIDIPLGCEAFILCYDSSNPAYL